MGSGSSFSGWLFCSMFGFKLDADCLQQIDGQYAASRNDDDVIRQGNLSGRCLQQYLPGFDPDHIRFEQDIDAAGFLGFFQTLAVFGLTRPKVSPR